MSRCCVSRPPPQVFEHTPTGRQGVTSQSTPGRKTTVTSCRRSAIVGALTSERIEEAEKLETNLSRARFDVKRAKAALREADASLIVSVAFTRVMGGGGTTDVWLCGTERGADAACSGRLRLATPRQRQRALFSQQNWKWTRSSDELDSGRERRADLRILMSCLKFLSRNALPARKIVNTADSNDWLVHLFPVGVLICSY